MFGQNILFWKRPKTGHQKEDNTCTYTTSETTLSTYLTRNMNKHVYVLHHIHLNVVQGVLYTHRVTSDVWCVGTEYRWLGW